MAGSDISPAKVVLLAVQLASKSDIPTLRTLVSQHPKTLRIELLLRILLSHLPESLDSAEYVPFLEDIASSSIPREDNPQINASALEELSEEEAKRKVRKLHLLPLVWPHTPPEAPCDPLILFLIHRSLRIDENTGLITELPGLLGPFLHQSNYLRTWMISTILPLLRMNYEYYPAENSVLSIPKFEALEDRDGVALLLSRTGTTINVETNSDTTIGRDLRGLVGPWMYGDIRSKRRKLRRGSSFAIQSVAPLDELPLANQKYPGWELALKWITKQAGVSWRTAVESVEQWDGPGDVDLGGFEDATMLLNEDDQQQLESRYARSMFATAYLIAEESVDALNGVHRILVRIIALMDKDRIPTLQAAAALLSPVSGLDESDLLSPTSASHLRSNLLDDENILTKPNESSIKLLHALLISAFLCTRSGCLTTIKKVAELVFQQDEREQKFEFTKLMLNAGNGPKGDDKYWIRMRNEILWLRSWGSEETVSGVESGTGRGVFGKLSKEFIEAELLKALLSNTRYTLARSIYETSPDLPLPKKALQDTIISAAMHAYDNATNANRTRGGIKKCYDILQAFPDTLSGSLNRNELEHLIKVTHSMGEYRLVFKQGEPFKPVTLRVHGDPISIIGKVLDQNPKSYANIGGFIDMGEAMVEAGLTVRNTDGRSILKQTQHLAEQKSIATKRIVSMCIDAALVEDDFETAYSYVVTRLRDVGGPAQARSPELERKNTGLFAELPPKTIDDWSWRAALQAGKYRRTSNTIKPTHLGNTSGNLEIRHLEQRMDCLSQALRLSPKSTLQEILNVYRRCEEELESLAKQEAEQEEAWDAQGDDQAMPGGFSSGPTKKSGNAGNLSRGAEEAPMSLFDLSRASMARAQSGLSSLSMLRGNGSTQPKARPASYENSESSRVATPDSGAPRTRKRDQLKNAAVGGLASGIGWLINAPPAKTDNDDNNNERQDNV